LRYHWFVLWLPCVGGAVRRDMLDAILGRVLERVGSRSWGGRGFMRGGGVDGRAVQISDLTKILKTTIASLQAVFICIDALDGCPEIDESFSGRCKT